jgi:hypothetical protein
LLTTLQTTCLFVHLFSASLLDNPDAIVEQIRSIPNTHRHGSMSTSMGIVNGGLALASTCWSAIKWKWVVDAAGESLTAHAPHRPLPEVRFTHPDRTPRNILAEHPVGRQFYVQDASTAGDPEVTSWLELCGGHTRPAVIVEVWAASAALYLNGPLGKPTRKAYLSLGYSQRSFYAAGTALGGAVSQARIVIVHFNSERIPLKVISEWEPPAASTHATRPMSYLLRTHGVPRQAYFHLDRHRPPNGPLPSGTTCAMPSTVGSWTKLHAASARSSRTSWQ